MATANRFQLTNKKQNFRAGQQLCVYNAIARLDRPALVSEIANELENDKTFSTTQTPERIAAYYVCLLKKSGHVEIVNAEPAIPTLEELHAQLEKIETRRLEILQLIEAETEFQEEMAEEEKENA